MYDFFLLRCFISEYEYYGKFIFALERKLGKID